MIRLFRKIRHKLLSENNYGIYILYASGEIILVVIGILFALQIDNWNETNKMTKEELGILVNLCENLYEAKKESSRLIAEEINSRDYIVSALNMNSTGDSILLNSNSDSIFRRIIWDVQMDAPVINSYSDIKNTGKIGLIMNQKIRQGFTNLELSINHLQSRIDDRLHVQQLRIDEIAINDINFVRMASIETLDMAGIETPDLILDQEPENDYHLLLGNQKIRNLLAIKLELTNTVIGTRQQLDDEINSLIKLLEDEIEE
jgi:hypothetical protein